MRITEVDAKLIDDPFLDEFQTSEYVDINYERSRGRYLVAKRDLNPGEPVIQESSPHVYMPVDEFFDSVCHYCLIDMRIGQRKLCGKCRVIHYCSVECQTKHWPIHKLECASMKYWFNRTHGREGASSEHDQSLVCLVGRAFLTRKHLRSVNQTNEQSTNQSNNQSNNQTTNQSINQPNNQKVKPLQPILKRIADEFQLVQSIQGESINDPTLQQLDKPDNQALTFFVSQVTLYVTGGAGCTSLAEYQSIRQSVADWRTKIQKNAFRLFNQTGDEIVARGLFIRPSLVNHSCMANCVAVNSGICLTVRPIRKIYSGEELTISYIDVGNLTSTRRFALLSTYGFRCKCAMCSESDRDSNGLSERDRQLDGYRCSDRECTGLMAWNETATASNDPSSKVKCSQCNRSEFIRTLEDKDDRLTGQLMNALNDQSNNQSNNQSAQSFVDSHSTILQQLHDFLSPRNMFHSRYLTLGLSSGIWTDAVSGGTMFARLLPYIEFMYGPLSLQSISVHVKYQNTCFGAKRSLQESDEHKADEEKVISRWRAALAELPQLEDRARTVCGETHYLYKRIQDLQQKGREALLTPANSATNWMTVEQ